MASFRRLLHGDGSISARAPPGSARRRKYGKYLPHQRANVDQAPLPFVNDMDSTYDEVGAKSVSISQLGGY